MDKDLQYKKMRHPVLSGMIAGGLSLALSLAGCAHIISKEVLQEVDQGISFEELSKDPVRYNGKTVLLGGVIVKTENKKGGTLLEIYQTELDGYGQPINTDISKGRFLAMDKRFLDSEIYKADRKVTIVGVVKGVESMELGEIDYPYPYILIREIHLWEKEPRIRYGPRYRGYLGPFWGDPWYRYYYWPYTWHYQYWPYTWYHRNLYNR